MVKYILIILVILMVLGILILIKKQRERKALLLLQRNSQKITNDAFKEAIKSVKEFRLNKDQKITSEFVSNVWGSKVTAFEYSIEVSGIKINDLKNIQRQLQSSLERYAKGKNLPAYQTHPVFVISDIWLFANVLHIDISHITNKETWSYVHDVEKSDHTK